MASFFGNFMTMLWTIFKIPFFICAIIGFFFFLMIMFNFLKEYKNGNRLKKGEHYIVKRPGFIKSVFWLAPKQIMRDYFTRDPEYFRHQGVIVYTGVQGSGKTVALVEQMMNWQKEYPKSRCITNLAYKYEDDELTDWRQLTDYTNDIYGVIVAMDEMQNWFSSNQSKNFPPEMLETITQNRKNRRVIMGTSQVFTRLSKPLREQTTEVRKCLTLFGCITIVHRVRPVLESNGDVKEWKHRGFYYFVHTKEIREAYDTYRVIESLSKSGFQEKKIEIVS